MTDLTPAAATLTAVFSPVSATPAPAAPIAPAVPTAPLAAPFVEPHSHSGISEAEAAKAIAWEKDNLAKGRITLEEATKRFDALGATPEQRAPDTRSDEVKQLDEHFPPAKESDFIIPYYPPGQAPSVLPKEVQAFDVKARAWMVAMGLSREQGNCMATIISKAIQQTHPLSANERDTYKDHENAKLDKLFGPDWDDRLNPAARMIREVDALHPGSTDFAHTHRQCAAGHGADQGRPHL